MRIMAKDIILGAFADEAGNPIEDQIAAMLDNGIKHLEARTVGDKNFVEFTCDEAKALKAKPLESLKPTLPRTAENFRRVLDSIGKGAFPLNARVDL